MKKYYIFLILLMFIPVVNGLYYTDKHDDFLNDTNISTIENLLVNNTRYWVQFNNSLTSDTLVSENTTDYTHVDVDSTSGVIQIIDDDTVYLNNIDRDEIEYVYLDNGVGYFENFTAQWDLDVDNFISNAQCGSVAFANNTGDFDSIGDIVCLKVAYHTGVGEYFLQLMVLENGAFSGDNYFLGSGADFERYITFIKDGGNFTIYIYTDSDRTNLVDTLNVQMSYNIKFRYVFWGITDDDALSGRSLTFYIHNLKYRTTGETDGYFTTVNLLNGITQKATTLLYNATIAESGYIGVKYSNNNSTWYNSQNVLNGSDLLLNGTYAFNLEQLNFTNLYLNFTFHRNTGIDEIRLNDITLIYETTVSGSTTIITIPESELRLSYVLIPILIILIIMGFYIAMKGR